MKILTLLISFILPVVAWASLHSPAVITNDLENYRNNLNFEFPGIHLKFKATADITDEEVLYSELQLVEDAVMDPNSIGENDKVIHLACCLIVCGGCKKESREAFESLSAINFVDELLTQGRL